jgi:hypothetical protein
VVAFVKRGKSFIATANCQKSSPRFVRRFKKGKINIAYCGHAEMILLDRIGEIRTGEIINVVRFTNRGQPTMAKPCAWCQDYMRKKGVRRVKYTNWNGEWEKMRLQ